MAHYEAVRAVLDTPNDTPTNEESLYLAEAAAEAAGLFRDGLNDGVFGDGPEARMAEHIVKLLHMVWAASVQRGVEG